MTVSIDGFLIDATVRQTHGKTARVTSHPVELGSPGSDHIIRDPDTLTLDCVVSNTPIGDIARTRANEEGSPAKNAYAKMASIFGKLVTVVTDKETYTSMALVSLSDPVDSRTGDACRFTVSFQKVTFVSNERKYVKYSTPVVAKKDNRGFKGTTSPPAKPAAKKDDENSSILWKLSK